MSAPETSIFARRSSGVALCYAAFGISGFAGLAYESLWARYLQTFLGAQAHAQALVLALFLGGMAAGAWLASRRSDALARPLVAYAVIELLLALLALGFHWVFQSATGWTFSTLVPALSASWAVEAWKWTLASALILPQCVLLGATFPLLAAGVIRGRSSAFGRVLGWLYFANSAGGAVGVLANGFLLVPVLGLPGAIAAAGALSAVAGLLVWVAGRRMGQERATAVRMASGGGTRERLCLVAALITGAASLVYEIVWIRLLNLVLGSSTHGFELMLSAFIAGLALGGFWIRRRADRIARPLFVLGVIQVVMGALALATVVLYREAFGAMHWMLQALARTEPAYVLYILGSHALALAVMLPATVCAGMMLPLLTRFQLAEGGGERVIGRIYAANTVGAILGVVAAMHLLLPGLGIKGAMLVGAGLDLALGAWLLFLAMAGGARRLAGAAVASGAVLGAWLLPGLDLRVLNSGVFAGNDPATLGDDSEVLFYRHGKTATVGVTRTPLAGDGEILGFTTNGKGNGALRIGAVPGEGASDEATFSLLGLLPLITRPDAERAVCIGVGTGLTAHNLLGSPNLSSLDIVELEPATIDAARLFAGRTGRIFEDTRVRFHNADAKTFFHSRDHAGYDVIVSQPSNVSMPGVAGLFTDEFYAIVHDALAPDGILVQWIQLYAADEDMVLSVLHALGRNFPSYHLYLAMPGDLLAVAAKRDEVPIPKADAFAWPRLEDEWFRAGVRHLDDLRLRWAGDRALIEPVIAVVGTPPNSDYRPILELRAVKAYFRRTGYHAFDHWMDAFGYPLLEDLAEPPIARGSAESSALTERRDFPRSLIAGRGARLVAMVKMSPEDSANLGTLDLWLDAANRSPCAESMIEGFWTTAMPRLIRTAGPNLGVEDRRAVWNALNSQACARELRARDAERYDFIRAAMVGEHERAARLGSLLLEKQNPATQPFVAIATAAALVQIGAFDDVLALVDRMEPPVLPRLRDAMMLAGAHAAMRKAARPSKEIP